MNTAKLTTRHLFFAGFLASAGLMIAALFFQYQMGLAPCPLCIVQRWFVIAVGVVLLAGALHDPRGWGVRVYGLGAMAFAGLGAAVAGRQVWIQHLPPEQLGSCGADLDYMLQNFPLVKTVTQLWAGTSDCATVTWSFLGLSMAGWMVVFFAGFVALGAWLLLSARITGRG